ncbi:MAG: hypothetical protein AAFQ07_20830, partial [Chloroflexota bacterium]
MTTPTASLSEGNATLQRILGFLGISFLIFFALVQTTPFVLTIANSFKCDAAVENRPIPFIPTFETVSCRDDAGEFISADEQVNGFFFNPSVDGYRQILTDQLPLWTFNTAFLSIVVTILRLIFDSAAGYSLARLNYVGNRA